jgi:hypothetical protein
LQESFVWAPGVFAYTLYIRCKIGKEKIKKVSGGIRGGLVEEGGRKRKKKKKIETAP